MSQTKEKGAPNPLWNTVLVIQVGLMTLELSQLIFDPQNAASLTTLDFNGVLNSMFNGLLLSANTITSFWAVLVAWAISGVVAGVRAKNGILGAFAGLMGTIIAIIIVAAINIDQLTVIDTTAENPNILIEFIAGSIACVITATLAAFIIGRSVQPASSSKKLPKRTRKIWTKSQDKDVWTCHKCGTPLPPGAFACPKCGEPVIE